MKEVKYKCDCCGADITNTRDNYHAQLQISLIKHWPTSPDNLLSWTDLCENCVNMIMDTLNGLVLQEHHVRRFGEDPEATSASLKSEKKSKLLN